MVLFVEVNVKELARLQEEYPWPRPERCPRCRGRIWGHGFVLSYFAELTEGVLLRRYRCPDCRCVVRLRPHSHWSRFQSSIKTIRGCIERYLKGEGLCRDGPRSRRGNWLRALRMQSAVRLGLGFAGSLLDAFDRLVGKGIIPVSRSMKTGAFVGHY